MEGARRSMSSSSSDSKAEEGNGTPGKRGMEADD